MQSAGDLSKSAGDEIKFVLHLYLFGLWYNEFVGNQILDIGPTSTGVVGLLCFTDR